MKSEIRIEQELKYRKFSWYKVSDLRDIWGIYNAKFNSRNDIEYRIVNRSHNIIQINYVESPRYNGKS